MATIKLKSIAFDDTAFRKLKRMQIEFAARTTLIAGHNGIGKSTLLGLIANASGLSRGKRKSYFGRLYQANLNEIIHIDLDGELLQLKEAGQSIPSPAITYEVDGEELVKRCAMTVRSAEQSVRVVARNDPHETFTSAGHTSVGKDAKVQLPTLYLGMTRMLPIGESDPASIERSLDKAIDAADAALIGNFVDHVISAGKAQQAAQEITTQSIRGTKKIGKHPKYGYDARCISLGQDSLSAIATAIASFSKLAREWPEYPGGLLIIDEIDAGFHPKAQAKIMDEINNHARHLRLQVVATTHSLSLIEHVHPDTQKLPKHAVPVDSVVYLTDTIQPKVADDYTLEDIQRDMNVRFVAAKKVAPLKSLPVYLEDAEAHQVFTALYTPALQKRVKDALSITLKPQAIYLGSDNLKKLHKVADHFRQVVVALDGDSTVPEGGKNFVCLPATPNPQQKGKNFNPECTLYEFARSLSQDNDLHPLAWKRLSKHKVTRDFINEHLLNGNHNMADRVGAKAWMTGRQQVIKDWQLVEAWADEHPALVEKFAIDLIAAAQAAVQNAQ